MSGLSPKFFSSQRTIFAARDLGVNWLLSRYQYNSHPKRNKYSLCFVGLSFRKSLASFAKLFNLLGLPLSELSYMGQQLLMAQQPVTLGANNPAANPNAPLLPQNTAQLVWLGVSAQTASALGAYVAVLPEATPLNLNTAGAEAIFASLPGLDIATAQQFVRQRANRPPIEDMAAATKVLGNLVSAKSHSISSKYFEIRGRLRLDDLAQEDVLLVERNGPQVKILWRYRAFQNQLGPAPDARLLQSDKS